MQKYNPQKTELKWQKFWEENKIFSAIDNSKKQKKYILVEFPYPSGAGLHMGHLRPYVAGDVVARFNRMKGFETLFPMGWDAFGLPAENYAIKMGVHPSITTASNIKNAKRQIQSWGLSFDWNREINTTDPEYYKWTQWLFLQFYKKGLAYEATGLINWCPKDKTGLANEEVIDGKCERCGTAVQKKELRQWYLRITAYAEKLLEGLKNLPEWPGAVKLQQANWIGKSTGAEIKFGIHQPSVKRFVLLHGRGSSPEESFLPWLKNKLEKLGYEVQVPAMPGGDEPSDLEQVDFVKKNCKLDESTVILGHSFGGIVALRLLEQGIKVNKVILASTPYLGRFSDGKARKSVVEAIQRGFDFKKIKAQAQNFISISDETDHVVPLADGQSLAKELNGLWLKQVATKSHFDGNEEPFLLENCAPSIKVFTTRPDTIFGATYMVVAPEHPLIQNYESRITNYDEVKKYIEKAKGKAEMERTAEGKEKTGVKLKGLFAINPATKEEVTVWVADYVLGHYGTGAIMAVPAHDERDFEFATRYNLPIKQVVYPVVNIDEKNTITLKTYEDHADKYIQRTTRGVDGVFKQWVDDFLKKIKKTDKILELGSGRGLDSDYIESRGYKVERTDAAESFISYQKGLGKEIKKLNAFTDKIDLNSYDLIFANKVLLHFNREQFKLVVAKINLGLRDNGIFALSLMDYKKATEHFVKDPKMESLRYFKFWKKNEVEEELKSLGFEIVDYMEKGFNDDGFQDILFVFKKTKSVAFVDYGLVINSDKFNGLKTVEAIIKMGEEFGKLTVQYKLRDWVFSRQRYWGEPIPLIHCEDCGIVPVPEKDLPVMLPKVKKYEPTGTGESPLANIKKWLKTTCPKCKKTAWRETNTMPQWAGSSWYWLRYADSKNKQKFADMKKLKYWQPVDIYFGGMEHTTLHLLYSRFWNLFLYDQGLVSSKEPYTKRHPHGIILGPDGEKMSKSRGNVVNPDEVVKSHGADTLRMYELFLGPHEATVSWNDKGVVGVKRFLDRVWTWVNEIVEAPHQKIRKSENRKPEIKDTEKVQRAMHKLIKKITEDIENFRFNTSISAFMEFHNEIKDEFITLESITQFLILLHPFAPHISEELHQIVGKSQNRKIKSLQQTSWPIFDPALTVSSTVEIVFQINGKVKGKITVPAGSSQEVVQAQVVVMEVVKQALVGETIKRVVFVPNRLMNLVI